MKKYNTETWISKAILIHGDKYNYSKVNYINSITKIIINCIKHGDFAQRPDMHINKRYGCPKCKSDNMLKTNEFFLNSLISKNSYNYNYDYSKIDYNGCHSLVEIICKDHGNFFKTPRELLKGYGFPKCNNYNLKLTTEKFIRNAKLIHNNKYDYNNSIYVNSRTKIEIICPNHGSFFQLANNHLCNHGCPNCDKSKGENAIEIYLNKNKIIFKPQFTFPDLKYKNKLRFDFCIFDRDRKLLFLIEFNGIQHYIKNDFMHRTDEEYLLRQLMDKMKMDYCFKNNIPLHIIRYDEDIEERLGKILKVYLWKN